MVTVIIVEDNRIIRDGLQALIHGTEGFQCSGAFEDCESMLAELPELAPDIILMDIGLPGISGIEGARLVKKSNPDIDILMLTVYEDNEKIFQALCAGASGYLIKKTPPARLLEALREVADGGSPMNSQIARRVVDLFRSKNLVQNQGEYAIPLTEREKQILKGLSEGSTYQGIAYDLNISIDTVRFHIRNVYRKLHVHSESEAVAKAFRKGYL